MAPGPIELECVLGIHPKATGHSAFTPSHCARLCPCALRYGEIAVSSGFGMYVGPPRHVADKSSYKFLPQDRMVVIARASSKQNASEVQRCADCNSLRSRISRLKRKHGQLVQDWTEMCKDRRLYVHVVKVLNGRCLSLPLGLRSILTATAPGRARRMDELSARLVRGRSRAAHADHYHQEGEEALGLGVQRARPVLGRRRPPGHHINWWLGFPSHQISCWLGFPSHQISWWLGFPSHHRISCSISFSTLVDMHCSLGRASYQRRYWHITWYQWTMLHISWWLGDPIHPWITCISIAGWVPPPSKG